MGPECVREFYEVPEDVRKNAVIHFNINIINDKSTVIKKGQRNTLRKYPQKNICILN